MGPRCAFAGFGRGSALAIKQESDFCLEAGGDSPFRKSLADSIGLGCIPMIFHPMTDHANELLWADWKEGARVLVPRDDYVAGRIELSRLVETAPPPLLDVRANERFDELLRTSQFGFAPRGDARSRACSRSRETANAWPPPSSATSYAPSARQRLTEPVDESNRLACDGRTSTRSPGSSRKASSHTSDVSSAFGRGASARALSALIAADGSAIDREPS